MASLGVGSCERCWACGGQSEKYFDARSNLKYENERKRPTSYFLTFPGGGRLELRRAEEARRCDGALHRRMDRRGPRRPPPPCSLLDGRERRRQHDLVLLRQQHVTAARRRPGARGTRLL